MVKSLQARLIAAAFGVLLTCGGLAALGSYRAAITEADEILDAHLAQLVQTLLFLSRINDSRGMGDIGVGEHSDHSYTTFQIWQLKQLRRDVSGVSLEAASDPRPFPRLILRSGDMGNRAESRRAFERPDGFSNAAFAARSFRILARTSADGVYRVIVGQDLLDRQEMVQGIARSNIQPYLLILPLGILALIGLIYHSLGPIRRLTAEVASREPSHMMPLSIRDVPQELDPLITALNDLLQRLHHAMESERRFTGDAAHELRTPIAALRAQLDAMRLATDRNTRMQAQQQASATANRLARLVNQLLTLSRLDAEANPDGQIADLAELARELCQDMGPSAIQNGIELSLHALHAPLHGDADALRVLIRNLLDNALRYTPAGGRVEVSVGAHAGQVRMVVADSGPGVAVLQYATLGQRFNRLDQPDGTGVGLGLSIVLRIAEQYRGHVAFGPGLDGRGLAVTVEFQGGCRASV
jgi:two-component system, OmpR family, sensor histidine kinase QseC